MSDGITADRSATARPRAAAGHQPHVLREYALLADGERAAVLGPRGDIVWLCAPRWHDPAVFAALIGGTSTFSLTPDGPYVWGGSYDEGSMIWRSRWVTNDGIVECREALAYPADAHRVVLLRRARALDRPAAISVSLEPRGDYDRTPMTDLHRHAGIWTARLGHLHLRVTGAADARPHADRSRLDLHLTLPAGTHHDLVLELSDRPASRPVARPGRRLAGDRGGVARRRPLARRHPEHPRHPPQLRRVAGAHLGHRRHGRRRHHQPARTRRGRSQLRLPLRLDPRPVLRRAGRRHRHRRRTPARRRRRLRRHPHPRARRPPRSRLHRHRRPRPRPAPPRPARLPRRRRHRR